MSALAIAVFSNISQASASEYDAASGTYEQKVQLDIRNDTGEDLDFNPYMSGDKSKGWTEPLNGTEVSPIPADGFTSKSGSDASYAMSFKGKYVEQVFGISGPKFDNYINFQVKSKSTSGESQITLTHDGNYRLNQPKKTSENFKSPGVEDFKYSFENQGNPAPGFDKKYRLSVTKNARMVESQGFQPEIKKITGASVERPIYKVSIGEVKRKYEKMPTDLKINPYIVYGKSLGPAPAEKIGEVVPVGKPTVDHANKTVTIPKTTFFFEKPDTPYPTYNLTVLDDAGMGGGRDLSLIPDPPADLNQAAISSLSVERATGNPVTANGAAQEALKVKLMGSGEVVSPDHLPELNSLYDYVYYRDSSGKLITGMYQDSDAGGYSAISDSKGAYVNELGNIQQAGSNPNRVYFSTTKEKATTVRANLNVTKQQQSPEERIERNDAADTLQGNGSSGISLSKGIADPESGAFHHYNGKKPEAGLVTRYNVVTHPSVLPLKNPYSGHLVPQNSGMSATLYQPEQFDKALMKTELVNSVGTYVASTFGPDS